MARTWIVQKAREDELADTLNRLEKEKGRFELHGIYVTGEAAPGPSGVSDRRPAFLVVGTRVVRKVEFR